MPSLPGMTALSGSLKTYAPWPVWSDSTTKEVKFQPLPKKAATRIWHRARDFDRKTRRKDTTAEPWGRPRLQVLAHADLRLPQLQQRAARPVLCGDSPQGEFVCAHGRSALRRLKELGILNWVRRCAEKWKDGRFVLEQETNAYAVLPPSQWRGYKEPPEPPPPAPGTWGDHPPLPSQIEQAVTEQQEGGGRGTVVQILDSDPGDQLAVALARLGRATAFGKFAVIYRAARHAENHSLTYNYTRGA